jgi:hypothetical protein
MIHHVLPMQFEAMLNKSKVMFLVIRNIKMVLYENVGFFIIQIRCGVVAKIVMNQD